MNGNLLTLTDPLGNVTTWTYDHLNRLLTKTQTGLAGSDQYQYDAAGNLIQSTDRNNKVNQYVYDALNRETQENWLDGGVVTRTMDFAFDPLGNLNTASDPAGLYSVVTRDDLNRVTEAQVRVSTASGSPSSDLYSTYDANGNRLQLKDMPSLATNDYTYDALNQLTSIHQYNGSSTTDKTANFLYDLSGDRTGLAGLTGTTWVVNSIYGYDGAGRLTNLNSISSQNGWFDQSWTYDTSNRVATYTNPAFGTLTYSYDASNELTGVTGANARLYVRLLGQSDRDGQHAGDRQSRQPDHQRRHLQLHLRQRGERDFADDDHRRGHAPVHVRPSQPAR